MRNTPLQAWVLTFKMEVSFQNVCDFCQGRKACCCEPFTPKGLQGCQKGWLLAKASPWSILNPTLSRAKASLFTVEGGKPAWHPASSPHQSLFSPWQGTVTCTDGEWLSSGGGDFCLLTLCFPAVLPRKGVVRALAGGHWPTTNCTQATFKDSDQEHALWAPCCSYCVFPLEGDVIFHSSKESS